MYDPDLKDFTSKEGLVPEIWNPTSLFNRETLEKYDLLQSTIEEEEGIDVAIEELRSKPYRFVVWSKEVFPSEWEEDKLLTAFKKRFSRSMPLHAIDLIFVESVAEEDVENQEAEGEGNEGA